MSQANIDKLQCVQNILARVVVGAPWTSSSLNIRRDLHWLPVGHCITYKLCLSTWKTLHTSQPLYLSELISQYLPSRSLRSSNTTFLTRLPGITSNFTSRAFSVSAPSTWNSLPAHIRYDTRCYFNVRSKAVISQLNLPHGNRQLKKCKNRKN